MEPVPCDRDQDACVTIKKCPTWIRQRAPSSAEGLRMYHRPLQQFYPDICSTRPSIAPSSLSVLFLVTLYGTF
ncbi:hypothetical protein L596_004723 [Steinernema carpocapsae]|uniref:Uncharacterized protein n=1 Tax=Steinernema carpocapsae TaxID=34508 RepID=A0A4V6I8F4_STECR|nr:hypothetical protein L596_004723 [Steinernema carpocapsae]